MDAAQFRQECRKYAQSQVDGQRKDFKRLGVLGDWDNPYLTMNYQTEADTLRALGKVIANGHFVRGLKPVYWCMDCQSALAEAEVEYADVKSDSIYVRFASTDDEKVLATFKAQGQGTGPKYLQLDNMNHQQYESKAESELLLVQCLLSSSKEYLHHLQFVPAA